MFFKKGLRDSSLICKLAMKNPRTSEEMLAIANKYAPPEEVTIDNRDSEKDKEQGQSNWPSTSKSNNKKRKSDPSVVNIEQLRRNKTEYRPRSREFEGFLDKICIFHTQGKYKTQDCDRLLLVKEVLKSIKMANQDKKPEAHKEVNYIYGGPNSY
jgi:hypothetical protein